MLFLQGFLFPIFMIILIVIGLLYLAVVASFIGVMVFFYYYFVEDFPELLRLLYIILCFCIISGTAFCLKAPGAFETLSKPIDSYAEFLAEQYPFMEDFCDVDSSDDS